VNPIVAELIEQASQAMAQPMCDDTRECASLLLASVVAMVEHQMTGVEVVVYDPDGSALVFRHRTPTVGGLLQ
jgi:hypothetical protein